MQPLATMAFVLQPGPAGPGTAAPLLTVASSAGRREARIDGQIGGNRKQSRSFVIAGEAWQFAPPRV